MEIALIIAAALVVFAVLVWAALSVYAIRKVARMQDSMGRQFA